MIPPFDKIDLVRVYISDKAPVEAVQALSDNLNAEAPEAITGNKACML
jgi:hypothetical protein